VSAGNHTHSQRPHDHGHELLLQGYLDGELDTVAAVEFEQHLDTCAACRQLLESGQALRSALRSPDLYAPLPDGFKRKMLASVRRATPTPRTAPKAMWRWQVAGAVAAVALVAFMIWRMTPAGHGSSVDLIARDVVSSHVRSLLGNHLTDVASTDQHTVKPWFSGKVDFSPPVKDLSARGYPLVGGRVDYVDGRPVSALVYQRRQHVIDVFIWPAANQPALLSTASRQGYNLVSWARGGMTFWIVSDLNAKELDEFSALLRE
jgi:anti-sigma factor RsiW